MKKSLCTILLSILAVTISACYSSGSYPWHRAECWYCEEIGMTVDYKVDKNGKLMESTASQLVVDGETYEVEIGFQSDAVGFLADIDRDGVYEQILDGIWSYRQEKLMIQIYEETIFNGKYTELVFVPVKGLGNCG